MATLLFSSLTDADPASPPVTHAAPTGSSPARIAAGQFDLSSGVMAVWAEIAEPSGDVITASVVLGPMGADSCGPALTKANGDAYQLLVRNTDLRLWTAAAGSLVAQINPGFTVTNAVDEKISIRLTKSTGLIEALKNDVVITSWTDATYSTELLGAAMSRGGTLKSVTVEGSAVVALIANVNGDDIVIAGEPVTLATSNFVDPVTSLTIGGVSVAGLTPTTAGNYSAPAAPFFVDSEVDPGFGVLPAVASNVSETASRDITRTLPVAWTERVMATLSAAADSIATVAAAQGLTIVSGDTLYNTTGLTIYDDSTISDADDGTHIVWHRAAATNVMTQINLIVSGGVIVTGNLTARALTARSLTSRSLTVRHL